MKKVYPCLSSTLWHPSARSPRKISLCFPDRTQSSNRARLWGVGGTSQKTCGGEVICRWNINSKTITKCWGLWEILPKKWFLPFTMKRILMNDELWHRMPDTYFLSLEYVIPYWSAPKINVEVCVAALHTHQTIPREEKAITEYVFKNHINKFDSMDHTSMKISQKEKQLNQL